MAGRVTTGATAGLDTASQPSRPCATRRPAAQLLVRTWRRHKTRHKRCHCQALPCASRQSHGQPVPLPSKQQAPAVCPQRHGLGQTRTTPCPPSRVAEQAQSPALLTKSSSSPMMDTAATGV